MLLVNKGLTKYITNCYNKKENISGFSLRPLLGREVTDKDKLTEASPTANSISFFHLYGNFTRETRIYNFDTF